MLALSACRQQDSEPPEQVSPGSATPVSPPAGMSAQPTPQPSPAPPETSPSSAQVDQEKAARGVLLEWARALELGQYDRAYAQWGASAEARSGLTAAEHAASWSKYKTITVAMPTGTMEGAAGSSYYTAPTTVVGKTEDGRPFRLEGEVVLRRVNDVPGATEDQLRWHIERVDLKPV